MTYDYKQSELYRGYNKKKPITVEELHEMILNMKFNAKDLYDKAITGPKIDDGAVDIIHVSPEVKEKLEYGEIEIGDAKRRLDEAERDLREAEGRIDEADERLGTAEDDLRIAEGKIEVAEGTLASLDDMLKDLEDKTVKKIDYDAEIERIQGDLASKVDGTWVDNKLKTKADADSVYTITDVDNMLKAYVSVTKYQTDQDAYVEWVETTETRLDANEAGIAGSVKRQEFTDANAAFNEQIGQLNLKYNEFSTKITTIEGEISNLGGANLASRKNVGLSGGVTENDYVYTLTRNSATNPYIRAESKVFDLDTEYVVSFKFQKISGDVTAVAGHSAISDYSTTEIYRDGEKLPTPETGWSRGDDNFPNDSKVYEYEVRFKTNSETSSNDAWYIQPNRPSYGKNYEVKVWDFQVQKGKAKTGYVPPFEDSFSYTETLIEQLERSIELAYVKDGELKAGIKIGEGRIPGIDIHITGDTLIDGTINAPNATITKITTREMTAIDTIIQSATITGTLNANAATFQSGTFRNMTAISATIQGATVTGTLNANNAIFQKGTFREMTAIDAIIEDAIITGQMTAGTIKGVDISGGRIYSESGTGSYFSELRDGEFRASEKGNMASNTVSIASGEIRVGASDYALPYTALREGQLEFGTANAAVDTIYTRYSKNIIEVLRGNLEISAPSLVLKTAGSAGWKFTTKDIYNHGFISSGDVGLKFTNSGVEQVQIRNAADSDYAFLAVGEFRANGDARITGNILNDGNFTSYGKVTADGFVYSNAIDVNPKGAGTHLYARPGSTGALRVTRTGTTGSYRPVEASSFDVKSLAELKQDIELWEESALGIINNSDIYKYRLISDVESGIERDKYSFIIGEGYRTPKEVLSESGESVDIYTQISINTKGIQEMYKLVKTLYDKLELEI